MNFSEFAKVIRGLNKIADEIGPRVASRIEGLVQQQFQRGTDPHGSPYAPLQPSTKERHGGGTPLETFGRHAQVKHLGKGRIIIVFDEKTARFHDEGTGNMAARALLPHGKLPASWQEAIDVEYKDAVKKHVKGGRA